MSIHNPPELHQGESVFLPPERNLWALRQAAKQAALEQKPACSYIVIYEDFYYPQILDQLLAGEKELLSLALSLGDSITGTSNGSLRCAALWDVSSHEGFLLHRKENELHCSYLPSMTLEAASQEHSLAMHLAALADEMPALPIMLDRTLQAGRYTAGELLHYLSEQMDV